MKNYLNLILAFSLIAGQLLRLSFPGFTNITLLDLSVFSLVLVGLVKSNFKLKAPPKFIQLGLIFYLWGLFTLIFSPLHLSLLEKINSLLYGVRFLLFLVLGYLVFTKTYSFKKEDFTQLTLLSGLTIALIGILQFIFLPNLVFLATEGWDPHLYRLSSTFLDPNFTGFFLVFTLIGLLLLNRLKYQKLFFGLVFLSLLLTFSRSAYLSFVVSFLVISLLQKSPQKLTLTIVLSLVLFLGFSFYQKTIAQTYRVNRVESAENRVNSWQQGLIIFQKNPILGIGFNGYRYGLKELNLATENQIQSHGGSSNDSSLLHVLATTGIIGLIIFIYFLWEIFKLGWKATLAKNSYGLFLISALAGLIVQSFFINSLFYPHFLILLILLTSII